MTAETAKETADTDSAAATETVTEVTGTDTAENKTESEETAGTTDETAASADAENQDAAAQNTTVPAEETEEENPPEETIYNVKIKVDNTEAGTIYAENADGDKEKIALEDNQYTTTVKEGEAFSFDVAVEDGYLLTEVQDQDGNTVASADADTENHTYTYEIKDIQADQTLKIAYAEVEDEITYPAFSYKGSEDDVTVNISAPEGVFPEGTEVELKALAEEDRAAIAEAGGCEPEEVVGLDITFTYEGIVIEPTGSVQVTFQADQLADEKYDEVKVFHVEKSGDVNEVEGTTDGDSVGFTADSFSPYGVTSNASEADISLTAETYDCELTVGDSTTLTIDINNQKQDGRWKSSDTSIVSISNDSKQSVKITGAKSGEATITYYYYKKGQEKTVKTFTVKVNAAQPVITFDLNGGTGTTPASITGEEGDVITLPASTGISRENYEFIGWSINSDANKVYANIGQYPIYEAGSTYELTKSLTMYAVWAQNNGTENVKLTIAIRDDGTVPGEPSLQSANYTYLLQTKTVNILGSSGIPVGEKCHLLQ